MPLIRVRYDGRVEECCRLDGVLFRELCPDAGPLVFVEYRPPGALIRHRLQVAVENVADVIVPPGKLGHYVRKESFGRRG